MRVVPKLKAGFRVNVYIRGIIKTTPTETIGRVDDKEENGQSSSMPRSSFHIHSKCLLDVIIVQTRQNALCTKCLSRADSGDDFLCEATTLCGVFQGEPFWERLIRYSGKT